MVSGANFYILYFYNLPPKTLNMRQEYSKVCPWVYSYCEQGQTPYSPVTNVTLLHISSWGCRQGVTDSQA